jgi:prophage antirepressor-like protein
MNAITPFVFEDNLVRTVQKSGQPWFVGKDVCEVLHIKDHHQALERLDDDERGGYTVPTPSGEQIMIVVSEAGVYRLIFTSRRPEAERFKRWLAHEVLPALRKNGHYGQAPRPAQPEDPFEITTEAIPVLQTKLAMVREARHLFGHERARALWGRLRLGECPADYSQGEAESADLLQSLLCGMIEGKAVEKLLFAALEGDEAVLGQLKQAGIWAEPRQDGFVVANRHPVLERILEGTEWADARWQWVLRRITGARVVTARRFGAQTARGVFLPCKALDFGEFDSRDH